MPGSPPAPIATKTAASSATAQKSAPRKAMDKLGLLRDIDLALHLPLRYEDETRLTPIAQIRDGDTVQVEGVVIDSTVELRPRRQWRVTMRDSSGSLVLRFLNFYPAQQKAVAVGAQVRARGTLHESHSLWGGKREMVHPQVRVVTDDTPLAASLTPVYPTSAQLPQVYLRKAVAAALARAPIQEVLPPGSVPSGLPSLREALNFLHHPPPSASLATLEDHSHPAWQRLKFEELLAQQISQLLAQRERARLKAPAMEARPDGLHAGFLTRLPFALTAAQERVCAEIASDLARPAPMNRLLQGDVGAGKTIVAALAATVAMDCGWQCALMAPTEILAEQHFRKLVQWLEPLGIRVAWLTGSLKGKARKAMEATVADGSAQLVIGTHAVIQDQVQFARLGLAIIDEQHRFGVAQRLALRRKLASQALEPHLLMMSATPIPRTLAMTYFADLDVSTIDELPPGRTPVLTKVFSDSRREDVIARVRDEISKGRQAYWVCPLIEDAEQVEAERVMAQAALGIEAEPAPVKRKSKASAAASQTQSQALELRNAVETQELLTSALPGFQVGLLHGRMHPTEKAETMARFVAAELQVLVATTVIEVGVDVPNASLMVIEHAERFGLSQLHQLRGRVGRGAAASVCVLLFGSALSDTGKSRLRAMVETTDGFEIARRDLEIRGPGEFMGARQSGDALLRFADLKEDGDLLAHARQLAPTLLDRQADAARAHVHRWLGTKAEFLKA